jgi:PKD repeat protein
MSWRRAQAALASVVLVTTVLVATATGGPAYALSITVKSFSGTENVALSNVLVATSDASSGTATINWGDGSATSTGTIDSSGNVTGSHTYTDAGSYDVSVTIGSTSASTTGAATIADANIGFTTIERSNYNCPGTGGQSEKDNCAVPEAGEGFPLTWDVQLNDPGPGQGEPPAEYTAVITWGDGSPAVTVTSTSASDGSTSRIEIDPTYGLIVHGIHTFVDEGKYAGVITMWENGNQINTMFPPQLLAVGDDLISTVAGRQTHTEGIPFSNDVVATFTDTNPDTNASLGLNLDDFNPPSSPGPNPCGFPSPPAPPKTYGICIDWGDGSQSAGTATQNPDGSYNAIGGHTYTEEGSYQVKVGVMDEGKAIGTGHTTYTIVDAPLTSSANSVSGTEGTPLQLSGSLTDANLFLDPPPSTDPATDYAVSIDWGDGTQSAGTVTDALDTFLNPIPGQFDLAGGHTYVDEGTYTITVTTTDTGGATTTALTTATVADADALNASGVPVSAATGIAFTGTVANVSDSFNGTPAAGLSATIDWGDSTPILGAAVTGASGSFNVDGTHTYAHTGSYTVTVTVTDSGGTSTSTTTTANVTQGDALTFTAVPVPATEGAAFSGQVETFTDISTTVAEADFAATIDWGDGISSGGTVASNGSGGWVVSGTHTYADEGSYNVKTTIAVDGTIEPSATTVATVGDAALSATLTAINPVEGAAFSGPVATFTDANPGATSADFTATITWGDGATSTDTVSGPSGGAFTVNGTHTYATASSRTVTVKVTDDGGTTVAVSGPTAVNDAPLTPSFSTPAPIEGQSFSGVLATFTDADAGGVVPDYSGTISWGDGTTSTGTIGTSSPGVFTVSGSHTYAEEGSPLVTVKIADTGGATASVTGTAIVADAPLAATMQTLSPVEGTGLTNAVVAMFTDPDPAGAASDYTATINWGDGSSTTGTVTSISGGKFGVSGNHTYAEEGTFTITATVADAGTSTSVKAPVTVADAALAGTLLSPAIIEGAAFTGAVAQFSDTDPAGTSSDYTATITWGDGHTSTGTISSPSASLFTITGTNTYAEEGVYPTSVTVKDAGGATTAINGNLTVGDANLAGTVTAPAVTEGGTFDGTVARFTDADPGGVPSDYAATITWGDGGTSVGSVTGPSVGGIFTVTGTHTYAEEGAPTLTVKISDAGGYVLALGSMATIGDAPLAPGTLSLAAGSATLSQVATFTFTDADPNGVATDYTMTVHWGDGTASTGTVAAGSGQFTGTATHIYASKNTYIVTVQTMDAGGASATLTGTATIKK